VLQKLLMQVCVCILEIGTCLIVVEDYDLGFKNIFKKNINFYLLFYIFLNHFDRLILKIIFLK